MLYLTSYVCLYQHMVNQNPGTWNVEFDAAALNLSNGLYGLNLYFTDMAGNTSVEKIQFTIDNPAPSVNGENFNTHSGSDYKGLNVGFNLAGFSTVSGVTVELFDGDTPVVANTHNQKLLDLIAGGVNQLSTPFITVDGDYEEEYWNLGTYDWASDSPRPTKAVVTVTGTNNLGQTVTKTATLENFTEPNGWTFASILPEPETTVDEEEEEEEEQTGSFFIPAFTPTILGTTPTQPFSQGFLGGNVGTETPASESNPVTQGNDNANNDILGEQDQEEGTALEDTGEVLGLMDQKFLGIGLYWYLIILAAIVGAWLLLAAAIRRSRAQE